MRPADQIRGGFGALHIGPWVKPRGAHARQRGSHKQSRTTEKSQGPCRRYRDSATPGHAAPQVVRMGGHRVSRGSSFPPAPSPATFILHLPAAESSRCAQ
jgi:hypothetical protein